MLDTGRAPPPSARGGVQQFLSVLGAHRGICVCPVPPAAQGLGVCPRDAQIRDHHQSSALSHDAQVCVSKGVTTRVKASFSCQHHGSLWEWLIKQHQLQCGVDNSPGCREAGMEVLMGGGGGRESMAHRSPTTLFSEESLIPPKWSGPNLPPAQELNLH